MDTWSYGTNNGKQAPYKQRYHSMLRLKLQKRMQGSKGNFADTLKITPLPKPLHLFHSCLPSLLFLFLLLIIFYDRVHTSLLPTMSKCCYSNSEYSFQPPFCQREVYGLMAILLYGYRYLVLMLVKSKYKTRQHNKQKVK